jgi:Fe-S-cluster containining protein
MSRWSDAMDANLTALYDQVPDPGCRGLCQQACGPIDMHPYERARIRRAGVTIPRPAEAVAELLATGEYTCPALADGRCTVYDIRPMLCRLYGAAEDLRCEHGCTPEGGHLPAADARRLINATKENP